MKYSVNSRILFPGLLCLLLLAGCGQSPETIQGETNSADAASSADIEKIRVTLGKLGEVGEIEATKWPGVYAVRLDGREIHTNSDGSLLLVGDMYRSSDQANLTDLRRSGRRAEALASLAPEDSINFAPEGESKHVVWVFTDVDCGYCQRLHAQMAEYNKRGIEVRYLPYPRAGKGSSAWQIAEHIWCADDRQQTLTAAKLNRESLDGLQAGNCDSQAVSRGHTLGQALGLRGTPMIIDERGYQVGGYVPPEELHKALESAG